MGSFLNESIFNAQACPNGRLNRSTYIYQLILTLLNIYSLRDLNKINQFNQKISELPAYCPVQTRMEGKPQAKNQSNMIKKKKKKSDLTGRFQFLVFIFFFDSERTLQSLSFYSTVKTSRPIYQQVWILMSRPTLGLTSQSFF